MIFDNKSSSNSAFTILRLRSGHQTVSLSNGFTIIELLVVIAVIGILAAITLVSYSGVSTRATIATMQSDLSSASTALRLDQATTDSFPASLALANNGRGIAPSQSMDDIIYVPDNTSNPKNFCLQYRKGTNTYAVDATTQPAKGVCLQNLIINGNFSVDGNGDGLADNYSANGVTSMSLAGNIQTYLSISQYSALSNIPQPYITTAHIFYTSVYVDSVGVGLYIYQGTGGSWGGNSHSAVAGFERLVVRTNIISSVGAYIYIQDNRSSGFTPIRVKKWITIDLTDTFGAGNEPSQATMDSILSAYPDSWFNIVAKANL